MEEYWGQIAVLGLWRAPIMGVWGLCPTKWESMVPLAPFCTPMLQGGISGYPSQTPTSKRLRDSHKCFFSYFSWMRWKYIAL